MKNRLRLPFMALLAAGITLAVIACGSDTDADELGLTTRTAELEQGVLIERDGCLRLARDAEPGSPSRAIVWQKDVLEITRVGDEVRIVDVQIGDPDNPVIWRLGQRVRASGASDFGTPDFHAGEAFTERCEGPYVLISGVN